MPGNHEYIFDIAAFEIWQREQEYDNVRDDEAFYNILRKVIKNELGEKEKECLYLYYYNNYTLKEIAELLNISTVAVWKRLKRSERKIYVFLKYAAELHYGRAM